MKHLVIVLLSPAFLGAALLGSPPSSGAEQPQPSPPENANARFLALVEKHKLPPEEQARRAAISPTPLSADCPNLYLFSFECARAIKGDRFGAAKAFDTLAKHLSAEGRYADALAVIRQIEHPILLLATTDLLTETLSLASQEKLPFDREKVRREIVCKHHFALSYRDEGEILVRRALLAALEGREADHKAIMERLGQLPTKEYLARAECSAAVQAVRSGAGYDFDALISDGTKSDLMSRGYPDFKRDIALAQFEIAMLELDRARGKPEAEEVALDLARRSLTTARNSKVFYGDLVIRICETLSERGQDTLAKELFSLHASGIRMISNQISAKPLLLAKVAPLFARWGGEFDVKDLLDEALKISELQVPPEKAKSLAIVATAWSTVGDTARANALWSDAIATLSEVPHSTNRWSSLSFIAAQIGSQGAEAAEMFGSRLKELGP